MRTMPLGFVPVEPISERDRPCVVRGGRETMAAQGRAGTTEVSRVIPHGQGGNQAVAAEDNEYLQVYLRDLVTTSSQRHSAEEKTVVRKVKTNSKKVTRCRIVFCRNG